MCSQFQIKATDVDFWSIDAKDLELKQKEGTYPPRFQIHAYARQCVCIPIYFQGTAEDIKTDLLLKPKNSGNSSVIIWYLTISFDIYESSMGIYTTTFTSTPEYSQSHKELMTREITYVKVTFVASKLLLGLPTSVWS